MKKFLLLILAVSVIGGVYAQKNSTALKDMRKAVWKNTHLIDNVEFPIIPLNPTNTVSSKKAYNTYPIGTSANVYMCLNDGVKWLSYNPELNVITFAQRRGGPWGPADGSGKLAVKFSNDFFTTKDSVLYTQVGAGLFRYPSTMLYNPSGNTDPLKAYSLTCGPSTNGSIWVNNFFVSQTLEETNMDMQLMTVAADTFKFLANGLSGGSGKYHATSGVSLSLAAEQSKTLYFQMYNGVFNSNTYKFDWTNNFLFNLFKVRHFGNGDATYNASENTAYADDGMNGYFYAIGKDSLDNPGSTAMPIVWKTADGGLTWAKEIYQHFATIPSFGEWIMPTKQSLVDFPDDPTQWVYRPNIGAGSVVDEGSAPGTVDIYGNLHIAAVVEGLYSYHADSLDYGYTGHPILLYDLIRTDTGWNAVFVDSIVSGVVETANSPYGQGTSSQVGWAHWVRISKNADGSKVFVTWTDTDPQFDVTNIMPEVKSWGIDVTTDRMTLPTSFASDEQLGNRYYMMAADKVATVGSLSKIPVTFLDIFQIAPDPVGPVQHWYLDGVEFDDSAFSIDAGLITKKDAIADNNDAVSQSYPNPTNGKASFNVTVKETSNINVVVTNVLGQIVYQTSKNNAVSGSHKFNLDTKNWNTGIYFYTVSTGKNKITKKMIVE